MKLSEFCLCVLSLLRVLGESCFKAPKITLDKFLQMLIFAYFTQKVNVGVSQFHKVGLAFAEIFYLSCFY